MPGYEPSTDRFEARTVVRRPHALFAWLFLGFVLAMFALKGHVDQPWASFVNVPWIVLGPFVLFIQSRKTKRDVMYVDATRERVRLGDEIVSCSMLRKPYTRYDGDRTYVALRGKRPWGVDADVLVRDDAEADRLCAIVGARSQTVELSYHRQRNVGAAVIAAIGVGVLASLLGMLLHVYIAPFAVFGFILALFFVVLPLVLYQQHVNVRIGADGLVVKAGFARRRFVSHGDVRSVTAEGFDAIVTLASGETMRLDCSNAPGAVEAAWRAYIAASAAPNAELALDRGGKTIHEWVEQLRRVGKGASATFREAGMTREELMRVIESTSAAAKARLAAVVALREGLTEEEKPRIRVAADQCVEPAMRERLVRVAFASDEEMIDALSDDDASARR